MERNLNDSMLSRKYILETDGQILFIQKWREMLHHKTINTYQVKLRNTHYILEETLMVIEYIKQGIISTSNLKDLLLESKKLVENDICLRKNFLELQKTLMSSFKKIKDNQEKSDLLKLEFRLKYALKTIREKYLNFLVEDLKEAINNNDLESINTLTQNLGSELINRGWASRSLYRLATIVFFNKNKFDEKWDVFKNHIYSQKQEFFCYFKLTKSLDGIGLETTQLVIKTGEEILSSFSELKVEDFDLNAKYIEEKSSSYMEDSHTAVSQCLSSLSEKIAFLKYYEFDSEKFTHTRIVYPKGEKSISYDLINKQLENNIIDKEDIIKAYNILVSNNIEEKSKNHLKNFFRQYNLSLDSLSIETKYSSLWTAIESILVTGHYSSNIEHIKKIIPSILSSQYVTRLLKNFASDCYRTRLILNYQEREINLSNPTIDDLKDLHSLLIDEDLSQRLLDDINDYTLCKLRTKELIEDLKNSETLKDILTNHYNTTTYHIQRMYRIRNNLVHAAVSEKDISLIIDHLNFYVHATVNEIIDCLSSKEVTNLGELFMMVEDNYYAILAVLEENIKNSERGRIKKYNKELIFEGALYF